jgi:hypothetical protein
LNIRKISEGGHWALGIGHLALGIANYKGPACAVAVNQLDMILSCDWAGVIFFYKPLE